MEDTLCPFRYARVESQLHRGAYPTLKNFRFLRRLALKTILSLTPEEPTQDLVRFCELERINTVHVCLNPKIVGKKGVTAEVLQQVMQVLLDADNYPVYMHCLDGGRVTGTFVMCVRKLQHWALPAAKLEFLRFLFSGVGAGIDSRGAEAACAEFATLSLPAGTALPAWLGSFGPLLLQDQHPTIRLRRQGEDTVQRAEGQANSSKDETKQKAPSSAMLPREHQLWDDPSLVPRDGVAYIDSLPVVIRDDYGYDGWDKSQNRQRYGSQALYVSDPDSRPSEALDLQDFAASGLLQALALEGVTMNPRLQDTMDQSAVFASQADQ
eukprot:g70938.t1